MVYHSTTPTPLRCLCLPTCSTTYATTTQVAAVLADRTTSCTGAVANDYAFSYTAGAVTIGRKGSQSLARLRKTLSADFPIKDPAKFLEVRSVGNFIQDKFLTGEYKRVLVAFNNFINTVTLLPSIEQLLPVNPVTLGGKRNFQEKEKEVDAATLPDYTFEPSAEQVFATVLPQYVNGTIYQMVLEARASEHSSRMVAMKNATDNAKQMLKDLSLEYNKLRQAAITNELLEITTAKMALG
jgi:F-type H+-transporting ATPase subunit gamma